MAGHAVTSLLPIIDGLGEKNIIILSTTSSGRRWLPVVRERFIASFQSLGLQAKDGTSISVSNVHALLKPGERDHFILLHGVERGKSIRMPSEIASLPPNRLAIIVKSGRVVQMKGLSDKEHFRVMVVDGNLEVISEITRRIAVIFGAPCIKAAEEDNVIWNKDPLMITVRRGKDEFSNLRLSILPRKVHSTSPFECITLVGSVSSSSSVELKRFMHIQSVNGLLLDGLSCEEASKVLGSIEEGPVFLMVRPASKDRSKLTSRATPLTDTPPGGTPGRTPPGLPPSLPPQPPPPPPPVYKGVCRLKEGGTAFQLKWTEKPIEVHLRAETLDLIPALITEPKARQQKATIIGYADSLPVWSDSRGHLIVAVNGVDVLEKGPQDVEEMISETPGKTLVSLVVYLCEEGPKPLAENVYSDIIKSYNPRQDQDTEASSKNDVDIGFVEQRPINKHPSNPPVYFAGSSKECSMKVYEVMIRGEITSSIQDESSIFSRQLSMEKTTPNVQAEVHESHSLHREDTSPSTTHPQFANCINLKSSGSTSSLHSPVEKPSLLTTKCVNDDWNPLPFLAHIPESLDNCGKFILQNINFRQLQEENITLCPLQEQLYLKPNTICVYSIDLEELTLSPHTSFTRLYEFLCFFHLHHNPKGMQVILVGAYDSSTKYGSTLDDARLDWFCGRIPEILQDKHINELLFEDLTKSRIHLIPFDLANPQRGIASLQDVIKECIKKYHLRVEATTDGNQKMPQSLKQWPLFLGKVMELSSSQPLISKEALKRLASRVLWIEGGQLFDQCLECLYQSSLLQTNGPVADSGLLTSPDLIVRVIAQLGDPNHLGRVLEQASKIESRQLKDYACVTTKLLQRTIRDLSGLSPEECSCLVEWMKYLKIALPVSSGASQDSYLFIPAITTSSHWRIRDNTINPEEAVELYVDLPESTTLLFFHDLVNSLFSQIDLTGLGKALTLDRACTKVRIQKLGLYPGYPMTFDVVLQYSVIQSQIKISMKPWQADLVTTAETYFKNLILKLDPSMESQLVIGPSFTHPLATARARSMSTFHFLEEVQRSPPSPSAETKPTYVVNAAVVRRQISNGIEPQVPIETTMGYNYFPISEIPNLNQWVYDPNKVHEVKEKKDMSLMRALRKVAEWLSPYPETCSVIACENGIISDAGPEALSLASNVGEPAAYKLICMWQARQLSISRLREALLQHHHNAAAAELEPFCHDARTPNLRYFLQNWHEDFVSSVDARAIVMYLKGERLIPEPVSTRIEGALTMRDANGLLFEHLLCQGVPEKLAKVFEVMKNEPGYDRMNKLGEKMGNKLSLYLSHR